MTFALLKGGYKPKVKPNYAELYREAFARKIFEHAECENDKQIIKQIIFYGVRYLNLVERKGRTREELWECLQLSFMLQSLMGLLTPAELIQIFPITKGYDGSKWQCKDYFYTMDKLREHGLDNPIGEAIDNILWDYMNPRLQTFAVTTFSIVDDLRRLDGQKGMLEEFAEQQGTPLTIYHKFKDKKGKEYLVNSDTGEVCRVFKKRPRYLRIVKD